MGSSSVCECEPDEETPWASDGRGVGSRGVQALPESKASVPPQEALCRGAGLHTHQARSLKGGLRGLYPGCNPLKL